MKQLQIKVISKELGIKFDISMTVKKIIASIISFQATISVVIYVTITV